MAAPVKHLLAALVVSAAVIPAAAFAGWRDQASNYDIARLQLLEQFREQAISEAEQRNGSGDFRAIQETISPAGRTVPARALVGAWRCRQMKLGGMTGYIVYNWYSCRVGVVNGGLFFQKENGSLKTQGFLYPENGAWIYLGAQSAMGEPWHRYSGRAASLGAPATPDDQIGLLSGIGPNRLRLEIPGPIEESTFDAIELER